MTYVPLRRQREIIVANFLEITLFPLRTVNECDIIEFETQQWVRFREIRYHDLWSDTRVGNDIRNSGLRPPVIDRGMTIAASAGSDIRASGHCCLRWSLRRGLRMFREEKAHDDGNNNI